MKRVVSIFFTNEFNEVLLLKRREESQYWPGLYHMLSGKVEEGEAPLLALEREIEEEIGIKDFKITKEIEPFTIDKDFGLVEVNLFQGYLPKNTEISMDHENSNWLWICPKDCLSLNCTPALVREIGVLGLVD